MASDGPPPTVYGLGEASLCATLASPDLRRVLLGWLSDDSRAASALRGTCTTARDAVAAHPWADTKTVIRWPARWRAAFPAATAASVRGNKRLRDADFAHFRGIKMLDMTSCKQVTISDAAFAHLAGIHTLDMSSCRQATITDAAFAHLAGIHTLDLSYCIQLTITYAAFAHLGAEVIVS